MERADFVTLQDMDDLLDGADIPEALMELDPLVALLLSRRGIKTAETAELFLSPDYDVGINDPWDLKDMLTAVGRILKAITDEERIIIFSDYDTDGIPGAVVLHDFFVAIGYENFSNIIPHRNRDGFGLKEKHVQEFVEDGADLVITIDCGISSVEPIAAAVEADIDVIVTDHHLPSQGDDGNQLLPPAVAVLDPQQAGCEYANKEICGAGVVWQLVRALVDEGDFDLPNGFEKWLLDMVGMATVADMVPLVGENRVLAHYGLIVLRKSRRPGVNALAKVARVSKRYITEDDIGFSLGPRINAASRMDQSEDAFQLLATSDSKVAKTKADHLNTINNQRKGVVAAMVKEARKKIESDKLAQDSSVVVVGSPKWKPSLCGLVATRLVDDFECPVFVWGRGGEKSVIRGSCRSDGVVDVNKLMNAVSPSFFSHCGGHAFSGGFAVSHEKVHDLRKTLLEAFSELPSSSITIDETDENGAPDATLPLSAISWETYDQIKQLAPFGKGNQKPIFLFEGVGIQDVKHFGKSKNHLKLLLERGDNGSGTTEAIAFFKTAKSFETSLAAGESISLTAHIEKDTFGYGRPSLRLRIVNIL